jgi:arsenate reductase
LTNIEVMTVYGIKQCDTCRKALKWLIKEGIPHQFRDFRVDGLTAELLRPWLDSSFSDKLVNRRSTTWRQLSETQRAAEGDALLELLLEYPTLIKRPVFVTNTIAAVGFNPKELAEL